MRRVIAVVLLLALLVAATSSIAQQPGIHTDNPPAASMPQAERIARASEALRIAVEAVDASKPRKPDRTVERLLGLASLILVVSRGNSSSAPPWPQAVTATLYGADYLVLGGDPRQVANENRRYRSMNALAGADMYDAALIDISAIANLDGEAAMRIATAIKDPYWKAKAMTHVVLLRIYRGDATAGFALLRQAVDFAMSGPDAARSVAASDAFGAALAALHTDPESAKQIGDQCLRLFPMGTKQKDQSAKEDALSAWADAVALFAIVNPEKAKAILEGINDKEERRTVARMAALRVAVQRLPAADGPTGSVLSAIWENDEVSNGARSLVYRLAGLEPGNGSNQPTLVAELLDMGLREKDMDSIAEIVTSIAEADPRVAGKTMNAKLARDIGRAADAAYKAQIGKAKSTYESLTDETMTMRDPYHPVWADYEAGIERLLSSWNITVRALQRIDPTITQAAVAATDQSAVTACGLAGMLGPGMEKTQSDSIVAKLMERWNRVPKAKAGSRFLGVGQQDDDRREFIRGTIGRTLALQIADTDAATAVRILAGTRYEYQSLREVAQALAVKDQARALSLLDACPNTVMRAATERFLASVVAVSDSKKAVAMFRHAEAQAAEAFAGSHKGFVPKDRKFDAAEKALDASAGAEDLSALLITVAVSDPAGAEAFAGSLADPYLRCQALQMLGRQANAESDRLRLLTNAVDQMPSVKTGSHRAQLGVDLAVTMSRLDPVKARDLAEKIEGDGYRAWALALIAARISVSSPKLSMELLDEAQGLLPRIKDHRQRARAAFTVARVSLGSDIQRVLSEADQPCFDGNPL